MVPTVFFSLFIYLLIFHSDAVDVCRHSNSTDGKCTEGNKCNKRNFTASCPSNDICCTISRKKCYEYGKYVYTQESVGALLARSLIQNVSQCHIEAVPLVVGGEKARPMEFPHMVAIGYGKTLEEAEWMCGGSLISEIFVLSAAHCSKSRDKGPALFARLGDLDLRRTDDESHVQNFRIIKRINHPEYKPPSRYHDIALFKLSRPVEMDAFSRPACLHTIPDELTIEKATATGWGKLEYNGEKNSDHLMKVNIDIIAYEECNITFEADIGGRIMHDGVIKHQLCAGDLSGGKDTCQGDSGGPLQVLLDTPYCMYEVIGTTSFGKFCGFKNSPAIYTRVSYYIQWIESVVWP